MNDRLHAAIQEERDGAVALARQRLADAILIAPFDDRGVAHPDREHGPGFAIFIGEWRIGWFPTREEACEAGGRLDDAIRTHPLGKL